MSVGIMRKKQALFKPVNRLIVRLPSQNMSHFASLFAFAQAYHAKIAKARLCQHPQRRYIMLQNNGANDASIEFFSHSRAHDI